MKPEPDEIDRIIQRALQMGAYAEPNDFVATIAALPILSTKHAGLMCKAIRAALKSAGFAIVIDEAQLLEKGLEVKIHD